MSKIWILVIVLVLGVATAGGIFFFTRNSRDKALVLDDSGLLTGKEKEEALIASEVYNDEAGFSFKYFADAKVKDITPNDDSYYSLLDVSKGTSSLTVKVQDGAYKPPTDAKLIGARTLGGMKASQYSYTKNGDVYLATFANVEGISYLIESKSDAGFFDSLHSEIADSFMIGAQTKAAAGSGSSSVIDEGEEIVE